MSNPSIPDEAVEAAARARGCAWAPAKPKHPACPECLEQARSILEAAAPFMITETWRKGANLDPSAMTAAHEAGRQARICGQPYEVWSDDSPETMAFWDGYYDRPLRSRE